MSRKFGGALKLDFYLNLSPPRNVDLRFENLSPKPCVSIELDQDENNNNELEASSMMVIGCPQMSNMQKHWFDLFSQ